MTPWKSITSGSSDREPETGREGAGEADHVRLERSGEGGPIKMVEAVSAATATVCD
jgi:hypothetical protein